MPTRDQKIEAARLRRDTRAAVVNTIRCGGSRQWLQAYKAPGGKWRAAL